MPRIDPERLLKTLAPLLEPASGAIKSNNEVDKIYGLMSKFSKKLVSKCTYINILSATHAEVLDMFLDRGGWDMVLAWTLDATEKKNYDLLKQICGLLLYAPANIGRLKENDLPKMLKSLSKDCENEEIRELAKKVVIKWITIAKNPELPSKLSNNQSNRTSNTHSTVPVQNSSVTSSKPVVNPVGELDISSLDMNADFNPEDFSKAVDQLGDLSEAVASGKASIRSISNANVIVKDSETIIDLGSNHQLIPRAPKMIIKTVDGQAAVHDVITNDNVIKDGSKKEDTPFCIMMKDGKPFLVRLKLASPQEVSELQNAASLQEITSTTEINTERRKPRKDPSIASMRTSSVIPHTEDIETKHLPAILKTTKTYSKKSPIEVIPATVPSSADPNNLKKSSSSKSSKSEGASPKKHRSSSSKSSSAAAAAAAKKLEEEEKWRDKIRQEKINVKKRAKEAANKQKQVDRDQETLKKLNLNKEPSVISPPNSSKIPKIPKKSSSFADAIGIPGFSDAEKTIKKKASITEEQDVENNTTKQESPLTENKERRQHRVKVFQSRKSRADDLLNDMTETVKNSKSNKSEKSSESVLMAEKSLAGNSLIFKPEKRPSIDGMEKPGDSKKQKIDESLESDKKRESKNSLKDKKVAAVKVIKESSLFMDALTANTDNQKSASKRKRRLSSVNDKELIIGKSGKNTTTKDKPSSPTQESQQNQPEVVKPVLNFYREILEDDDEEEKHTSHNNSSSSTPPKESDEPMDVSEDQDASNSPEDDEDVLFIPTEEELTLKSVLVIHRSKNKPKKSVRFREEEELVETFTFELDEQERINVTKHKDFLAMKDSEKAEEKSFMVGGFNYKQQLPNEDAEERMPWRRPLTISLFGEQPVIDSKEKAIQEERERLNLGVFLPPGSVLPDTPSEPEIISPNEEERTEFRIIPVEDVFSVTKVFDNRNMMWAKPVESRLHVPRVNASIISPNSLPNFGMSSRFSDIQQAVHNAGHLGLPNQSVQPPMDFNNPWNMAGVNPPIEAPIIHDVFPSINLPRGPIGFPPPNIISNPFGFPMQRMPMPPNFPPVGLNFAQAQAQMAANIGRDLNNRPPQQIISGRLRDFGDKDLRRPIGDARDRDSKRESYDSRGRSNRSNEYSRSRDHDRDRRSPSPRRRRDDRDSRQDKDYRDHDYRSSRHRGGKKDVPCKFFQKGNCQNGSRCEFMHESTLPRSFSRQDSSSSRSNDIRCSPPSETWEVEESNDLSYERRPSSETSRDVADTPSSPTMDVIQDMPTKIIPVE